MIRLTYIITLGVEGIMALYDVAVHLELFQNLKLTVDVTLVLVDLFDGERFSTLISSLYCMKDDSK